jgi:hypothetical protein
MLGSGRRSRKEENEMTKEEYIKTITQGAATLLAGQPRSSDFGVVIATIQVAVADAGYIFDLQ